MKREVELTNNQAFNSIKVRLKHEQQSHDKMLLYFQFHKGAIETHRVAGPRPPCCLFQFHKGAIETAHKGFNLAVQQTFNSIKVRLKHLSGNINLSATTFQFHKGAIETVPTAMSLPTTNALSIP